MIVFYKAVPFHSRTGIVRWSRYSVSACDQKEVLTFAEQWCERLALLGPVQAENLLVAEDGRVMLADFGATAKLEHARYSLPSVHLSDSSSSLSASCDGDGAVQSSGPSSEIRIEVGTCSTGLGCHLGDHPPCTLCSYPAVMQCVKFLAGSKSTQACCFRRTCELLCKVLVLLWAMLFAAGRLFMVQVFVKTDFCGDTQLHGP